MAGPDEVLARYEGLGSVSICGCGTVSLHVGGVTLRLEATAFIQLDTMIQDAIETLRTRALEIEEGPSQVLSLMTH